MLNTDSTVQRESQAGGNLVPAQERIQRTGLNQAVSDVRDRPDIRALRCRHSVERSGRLPEVMQQVSSSSRHMRSPSGQTLTMRGPIDLTPTKRPVAHHGPRQPADPDGSRNSDDQSARMTAPDCLPKPPYRIVLRRL